MFRKYLPFPLPRAGGSVTRPEGDSRRAFIGNGQPAPHRRLLRGTWCMSAQFASMSRTVDRRTTMADATTYEDVALPAEQVWKVIGNFANIRAWAVVVQDEM